MNKIYNKKIIITGASGYLGSSFLNLLIKKNIYISTLGRKEIKNITNHYFNFNNLKLNNDIFKNCDYLIHFASIAHTGINSEIIAKKDIMDPSIFLAKKALENNLEKFIYISSSKSIDDTNSNIKIDLYGKYKKLTEIKLINIFKNTNTELIIIRPTLVYGGNHKGNLKFLSNYISRSPIVLLPNINNNKSMVHLDNLVESIFCIIFINKIDENIITISDKDTYSFNDICKCLNIKFNRNLIFIKLPFLLKIFFIKYEKIFKIKFFSKLYNDEVYKKSNIEKYGYIQKKNINNINETNY